MCVYIHRYMIYVFLLEVIYKIYGIIFGIFRIYREHRELSKVPFSLSLPINPHNSVYMCLHNSVCVCHK